MNYINELCQLLLSAIDDHIAPNVTEELVYKLLLDAGIDEKTADRISTIVFDVWPIEPPADMISKD